MTILGIDPGISGALAWVSDDGHLIEVCDMPVIEIHGKRKISAQGLAHLISARKPRLTVIEEPSAMPGQGVVSMHSLGFSTGVIFGVCAGLGLPTVGYRPAVWKRQAGVPADKGAARQMAQRYWPGCRDFDRVKDDGRAEAALLARWIATKGGTNA